MADCSAMATLVNDLAMAHGADPAVKNIDDVVKKIQEEFPEIQRDHVVGAILEVGKANSEKAAKARLTTGEINSKLQALRSEAKRTSEPFQQKKLQDQIADLQRQKDEGFKPAPARPTVTIETKQLERLAYEKHKLEQEKRQAIEDLKPKSVFEHVIGNANAAKSLMATGEFSFIGRQGKLTAAAHPLRTAAQIPDMIKSLFSEQYAHKIDMEIEKHPLMPLAVKSKVPFIPSDAILSGGEKAFASHWIERIPVAGKFLRSFNNAGRVFINRMRMDSFAAAIKSMTRNGEPTLEESQQIGKFVSEWTGHGSLGGLENSAKTLNSLFFSPRYFMSRFQVLVGHSLWGGTMRTRSYIASEHLRAAVGLGLYYTLIGAGTAALNQTSNFGIETDSQSTDFGKIKVGNTRLDPLAGLSQAIVFARRMISGKTKDAQGIIKPIRGPGVQYGDTNARDVASQFAVGKLAPIPGTIWNYFAGQDAVGNPFTWKDAAVNMALPMTYPDVVKAAKEQNIPTSVAFGLLAFLGEGLQTYSHRDKTEAEKTAQRETSLNIRMQKASIGARK